MDLIHLHLNGPKTYFNVHLLLTSTLIIVLIPTLTLKHKNHFAKTKWRFNLRKVLGNS